MGGGPGCSRATAPLEGRPRGAQLRGPDGPGPDGGDHGTGLVTRTVDATNSYWAGLVAQDMGMQCLGNMSPALGPAGTFDLV